MTVAWQLNDGAVIPYQVNSLFRTAAFVGPRVSVSQQRILMSTTLFYIFFIISTRAYFNIVLDWITGKTFNEVEHFIYLQKYTYRNTVRSILPYTERHIAIWVIASQSPKYVIFIIMATILV